MAYVGVASVAQAVDWIMIQLILTFENPTITCFQLIVFLMFQTYSGEMKQGLDSSINLM